MVQYAFLVGTAPQDYRQKRLVHFYNNLKSEYTFSERDIYIFPNGVDEILLEYALTNAIEQNSNGTSGSVSRIFLYICALSQDCIKDDYITLGNDEIRKLVIAHYAAMAKNVGIEFEIIYDSDGEVVSEESLGWERVEA